jgi:hypothetical protein
VEMMRKRVLLERRRKMTRQQLRKTLCVFSEDEPVGFNHQTCMLFLEANTLKSNYKNDKDSNKDQQSA